jgi:Flp pilus assembly protein TadD
MSGTIRLSLISVFLCLLTFVSNGQDLGSSNKLFGAAKTKTPPSATKKTPAKPKSVPAKQKAAPVETAKTKSRPKTAAAATSKKTSRAKTTDESKTVPIKLGSKPENTTAKGTSSRQPPAVKEPKTKVSKVDAVPEKQPDITPPVSAAASELYEKLIEDGNFARDDRNYSTAESAYRRARSIKPRDSRAIFGLGNLYSDQQRWDDAENAYREALKLESNNAVTNIALSYVLSQPIVTDNLGDRYEEAERLAKRATEIEPRNALAFDQLGVAMELRGLISGETENAYRTAIRLDPSFAPPYAHLGRLLRRRGRVKESAEAYESAIRHSTDVATMILVADVMQSEQRYAESEPLLRAAVANDPRNPSALLLLGQALTTTGNFSDAERFLKRSIDVSPNAFSSNSLLGSLYIRQGKFDLAERSLMQALRYVSPNEKRRLALQFENVGDGYLQGGKIANAERVFRQAKGLDPENESIGSKLARTQHR